MEVYTNGRDDKLTFIAENAFDCYLLGRASTKLDKFSVYMCKDKVVEPVLALHNELEVEVLPLMNFLADLSDE
ncbi:hypothetical protein LCGC14_1046370 [marine sediment metagenome]|uniref:Uncharacterized protein n=1 Tax=marine sediment metagenome TaxID=412755 RepID=A0A0F9NBZ4_9ZZZZ